MIAAVWVLIATRPEHEREILGGPIARGNATRINGNGNRNIMLKVSQWKQIIGLLSVAQHANERPRERADERAHLSQTPRFVREMEMTGYRI